MHSISNRKSGEWTARSSERIKDMKDLFNYSKFNSYNYIKADENLMKLYNDKMLEYEKLADKEKQDAIDKELADKLVKTAIAESKRLAAESKGKAAQQKARVSQEDDSAARPDQA